MTRPRVRDDNDDSEIKHILSHDVDIVVILVVVTDQCEQRRLGCLFDAHNQATSHHRVYHVHFCATSERALELLVMGNTTFDLVLIDIFSGSGLQGHALVPLIKAKVPLARRPSLVMFSALRDGPLALACLGGGASAFLVKPIHLDTIASLWQHCSGRSWQRRRPCSAPPTPSHCVECFARAHAAAAQGRAVSRPTSPLPLRLLPNIGSAFGTASEADCTTAESFASEADSFKSQADTSFKSQSDSDGSFTSSSSSFLSLQKQPVPAHTLWPEFTRDAPYIEDVLTLPLDLRRKRQQQQGRQPRSVLALAQA